MDRTEVYIKIKTIRDELLKLNDYFKDSADYDMWIDYCDAHAAVTNVYIDLYRAVMG